jgi:hypothetical protein
MKTKFSIQIFSNGAFNLKLMIPKIKIKNLKVNSRDFLQYKKLFKQNVNIKFFFNLNINKYKKKIL